MTLDKDFLDLMPNTITWEAFSSLSTDGYGAKTYAAGQSLRCRIQQTRRLVRGLDGQEIVSTTTLYAPPTSTTSGAVVVNPYDRITLPSGFLVAGSSQPPIISVYRGQDETAGGGASSDHHIEVYL